MPHLMQIVKSYIEALSTNSIINASYDYKILRENYENNTKNILNEYDEKRSRDGKKFSQCFTKLEETTNMMLKDINKKEV